MTSTRFEALLNPDSTYVAFRIPALSYSVISTSVMSSILVASAVTVEVAMISNNNRTSDCEYFLVACGISLSFEEALQPCFSLRYASDFNAAIALLPPAGSILTLRGIQIVGRWIKSDAHNRCSIHWWVPWVYCQGRHCASRHWPNHYANPDILVSSIWCASLTRRCPVHRAV